MDVFHQILDTIDSQLQIINSKLENLECSECIDPFVEEFLLTEKNKLVRQKEEVVLKYSPATNQISIPGDNEPPEDQDQDQDYSPPSRRREAHAELPSFDPFRTLQSVPKNLIRKRPDSQSARAISPQLIFRKKQLTPRANSPSVKRYTHSESEATNTEDSESTPHLRITKRPGALLPPSPLCKPQNPFKRPPKGLPKSVCKQPGPRARDRTPELLRSLCGQNKATFEKCMNAVKNQRHHSSKP